ncbi:gastric triacylglycerol lipase-like [Portunus trituberculatus]|uniref:gastric triacylglycerol lipase-like n=1 Tax=Portunus trituberculatus TaxID=210409 RepID=UPI001E1D06E2|nr:gastric triacylglycerol lipase-like [Portunus trituberculatus]
MVRRGAVLTVVMVVVMLTAVSQPTTAATVARRSREPRQVSMASILNLLMRNTDASAPQLDTAELGRQAGYKVERHTVVTADGYILTMHHIPPYANPARRAPATRVKRSSSDRHSNLTSASWATEDLKEKAKKEELKKDEGKKAEDLRNEEEEEEEHYFPPVHGEDSKVVFLQHGLMGSSDNWNTNTYDNSLAYLLSDAGYDVWMGNFRGNIYSRRHVNFTHQDPQFWRFSYDEMAKHDLPAMLEHVLVETGVEKVVYVGHSMGTTVFFATMSSLPDYYQDRIAAMVALAPVATIKSISSPIKYLAPLVNELHYLLRFFGNDQEVMTNPMLISLWDPYRVCRNYMLCENIQFMITGFDPARADESMVPVILSHNPAGSSTQTLFHFAQGYTSGRFQKFDFGLRENIVNYGQEQPPEYDISRIKVPITLFWADNDWLTGQEDINNLRQKLPNLQAIHKVSNPIFSHLDFLWATDARPLVYDKIFEILDRTLHKYF